MERAPPLDGRLEVVSRQGSDIAPIDVADEADRLRLRSYIWADQALRLSRLDAAIELAADVPFSLEKADAAQFVKQRLGARRPGSVFVLFHSIMWQYIPETTKAEIEAALAEAGETASSSAPIAWLRMEPHRYTQSACHDEPDAVAGRRDAPPRQMRLPRPLDRVDGLTVLPPGFGRRAYLP